MIPNLSALNAHQAIDIIAQMAMYIAKIIGTVAIRSLRL